MIANAAGKRMVVPTTGALALILLLGCGPERPTTGIVHDPNERQRDLAEAQAAQDERLARDAKAAEKRRAERRADRDAQEQLESDLRRRADEREMEEARARQEEARARQATIDAAAKAEADAREAEDRKIEAAEKAAACAAVRRTKCTADCQGNPACVSKCVQKAAPCN